MSLIRLSIEAETAAELWDKIHDLAELQPVAATVESTVSTGPIQTQAVAAPKRTRQRKNVEAPAATPVPAAGTESSGNTTPVKPVEPAHGIAGQQGQSAPDASAPAKPQAPTPSIAQLREAALKWLSRNGESQASCPKFTKLLKDLAGVDRITLTPEDKRAVLLLELQK